MAILDRVSAIETPSAEIASPRCRVALRLSRRRSSNTRYIVARLGLAAMMAAPIVTALMLSSASNPALRQRFSGPVTGATLPAPCEGVRPTGHWLEHSPPCARSSGYPPMRLR